MQELTQEILKTALTYAPETGEFTWNLSGTRHAIGAVAGTLSKDGYRRIMLCRKSYLAHRLAWLYVNGCWPSRHIDHIDQCRMNNAIHNLRDVSRAMNMQNQRQAHRNSTTGVQGVSSHGLGYLASIRVGGKSIHIGKFNAIEPAREAYHAAKRALHPGYIKE